MKRLLVLFLTMGLLLSLTACGEKDEEDSTTDLQSFSETVVTKADSLEELSSLVTKDVHDTIGTLNTEWKELSADTDTYDKYKSNFNEIAEFYKKVPNDTQLLCIRLREYSYRYAELILSSDKSFDDKYDELDIIYDFVYEDACDDIYDEIYGGILDEMYDAYYDGVLDDAYDSIPYDEWSDACSDEYNLWSDTSSEVYDAWSDASSDIYDFSSDIQGEMWDNDMDRAEEKLRNFKDKIESLKSNLSEQEVTKKSETTKKITVTQSSANEKQWKQFLADYEEWVDDYIKILKKYNENPTDMSVLSDYTEMLTELAEWQTKTDEMEAELEEASPSEVAEYSAELLRIAAKITEATY